MNNYNLKGRVAVVTGGAQGFGYAITKRLLEIYLLLFYFYRP